MQTSAVDFAKVLRSSEEWVASKGYFHTDMFLVLKRITFARFMPWAIYYFGVSELRKWSILETLLALFHFQNILVQTRRKKKMEALKTMRHWVSPVTTHPCLIRHADPFPEVNG